MPIKQVKPGFATYHQQLKYSGGLSKLKEETTKNKALDLKSLAGLCGGTGKTYAIL